MAFDLCGEFSAKCDAIDFNVVFWKIFSIAITVNFFSLIFSRPLQLLGPDPGALPDPDPVRQRARDTGRVPRTDFANRHELLHSVTGAGRSARSRRRHAVRRLCAGKFRFFLFTVKKWISFGEHGFPIKIRRNFQAWRCGDSCWGKLSCMNWGKLR